MQAVNVIPSVPNTVRSSVQGFGENDPYFPTIWTLRGSTKDSSGAALANVTVDVFKAPVPHEWVGSTVSGADGTFSFNVPDPTTQYFFVAYLAGATPVAGTTIQNLVGV